MPCFTKAEKLTLRSKYFLFALVRAECLHLTWIRDAKLNFVAQCALAAVAAAIHRHKGR
jgi:hypothetical protein